MSTAFTRFAWSNLLDHSWCRTRVRPQHSRSWRAPTPPAQRPRSVRSRTEPLACASRSRPYSQHNHPIQADPEVTGSKCTSCRSSYACAQTSERPQAAQSSRMPTRRRLRGDDRTGQSHADFCGLSVLGGCPAGRPLGRGARIDLTDVRTAHP